jgi:hypothetical protein
MGREVAGGVLALALAGAYWIAADALPTSLLADAVGADGMPKLLAIALAALGVLQLVRVRFARLAAGEFSGGRDRHIRAVGLLAIACAYVALLPFAGYPVALAMLVLVTILYVDTGLRGQALIPRISPLRGSIPQAGEGARPSALAPQNPLPLAGEGRVRVGRQAPWLSVVTVSAAAGLLFWAMFVKMLGVPMPVGRWPRLFG